MADSMRLVKVKAEGLVTSFRYPHFTWQKQPSFEMPPPATIYGHICSAVGDWVDPASLKFAYQFTFESKVEDLEHIWAWDDHKKRDTVKPIHRELLFRPRLILYINQPELAVFFKNPRFVVVLGRSQDLFTYTSVEVMEAITEQRAYYEHTLLPLDMLIRLRRGIAIKMPRFLDYRHQRSLTSGNYAMLRDKVVYPALDSTDTEAPILNNGDSFARWIDPTERDENKIGRGLVLHTFVD